MAKVARSGKAEGKVVPLRRGRKTGKTAEAADAPRPMAPNAFRMGYLIHDVSRMRRRLLDHHLKPEGITRSQWWVLSNLSRQGADGIVTTKLAKLLDVGKVTLGGLIDRLEAAGYVYRKTDKNDRRARQIFITEDGYALIERMKVIVEDLNKTICEEMTEEEIAATEMYLMRLKDRLRFLLAEEKLDMD